MDQEEQEPDYISVALNDRTFDDHSGLNDDSNKPSTDSHGGEEAESFLMSLEAAGGQPIDPDAILVFDATDE